MKRRGPRWVFFRAYLMVALLVLFIGLILEKLLEPQGGEFTRQREHNMMIGSFLYVENLPLAIEQATLTDSEQRISKQLEVPVSLHSLDDFIALSEPYKKLLDREIVVLFDHGDQAVFYRRLGNSEWVLALSPPAMIENERAQWIVPLFYSLVALAVFLWIRPLSRDLEVLHDSAISFGKQDFSTRVSIPPGSWLASLGSAFNSMAQRIQTLLQSHQELTHAVSHELRTPLARILFSLEMLQSNHGENLQRHCDAMSHDVADLNTLIEEMLGYAELNQDNLTAKREPVLLELWLIDYVDNYKRGDSQVSLRYCAESLEKECSEVTLSVDKHLLARALDNLVGNALRYAKSSVEVSVQLNREFCQLHVRDDGPGIPPDQHTAVLSAYTRLEPSEGNVKQGFGLGLAIVKRIMDLHAGDIIIATTVGGGADISLRWISIDFDKLVPTQIE